MSSTDKPDADLIAMFQELAGQLWPDDEAVQCALERLTWSPPAHVVMEGMGRGDIMLMRRRVKEGDWADLCRLAEPVRQWILSQGE